MDPSHERSDGRAHALQRLLDWADGNEAVRAVILEGSRGDAAAKPDAFSDYDVALVVANGPPFAEGDEWATWLGEPVIHWGDHELDDGIERRMRLVIYEDGTRFDYCLWTIEAFARIKQLSPLPAILDSGYEVLLDKDGVTAGLAPASQRAHIPLRPREDEFVLFLDDFWIDAAYVAKSLARRELLPAKFGFSLLTLTHLRRLLEWRIEVDHGWSQKVGRHGRGLRPAVPADRWRRLEATFSGADLASNWTALWSAIDLHTELAHEIAGLLGFSYPSAREAKALDYIRSLHDVRL